MHTIAQDNPFAGTITISRGPRRAFCARWGGNHAGSRRALWTGRVISGLAVAFLIFDSVGKLLEVQPVIDGTKQLGYPPDIVFSLGVTLLSCAQREARCPDAGGRGVLHRANGHGVQRDLMRMRFIILHKTNPHWESGAIPGPELIARGNAARRTGESG